MELYQLTSGEWVPVPKPIPLQQVIRAALLNALAYTAGDQRAAALWLGLSTKTMGYQMAAHAIPDATQIGDAHRTHGIRRHLPKTRRPKES